MTSEPKPDLFYDPAFPGDPRYAVGVKQLTPPGCARGWYAIMPNQHAVGPYQT